MMNKIINNCTFFFLLLTLLWIEASQNTGVKVRITKAGLNYGAKIAIDLLEERIRGSQIPDQSGNNVELSNIRVTSFEKPTPYVSLNPGSGLSTNLNNAALIVEANWKYSVGRGWFKIVDSGRLKLSSSRFTIGSSMQIGVDGTGRPTASASSCHCSIQGFDVKFYGGFSIVYNLFAKLFEGKIRSKLEEITCKEVVKLINNKVKDELASLNVNVKIDNQLQLDYSMTSQPIFTDDYLESSHVGEFISGSLRYPVPPTQSTFSMNNSLQMATIGMSERLFNSGAFILKQLGRFNFSQNFVSSDINALFGLADENLSFELYPISEPIVQITPFDLRSNLTASLRLFSSSNQTSIITVQFKLFIIMNASIDDGRVNGKFISMTPTVISSQSIEKINMPLSDLQDTLSYFVDQILPSLNDEAAKGFPLPRIDFVKFVGTRMEKLNGVVIVSTDVVTT